MEEIPVEELKIGMYVHLDLAWYEHPFLKNHFHISSSESLKKIKGLGLKTVKIDPSKSQNGSSKSIAEFEDDGEPPSTPVVPEELLEAIHDRRLEKKEKARLIQQHAITMMKNLLENPNPSSIREVKKGAHAIVDLILKDQETTFHLVNITDHDYSTYTHSVNVGLVATALAKAAFRHSYSHDLHALGAGFLLHDLGKVKVGLDIINKPGKLTDEEMKIMKRHPAMGYFLLQEAKQMNMEYKLIVLHHHEKIDGTGYPSGIKGNDIHIYARLCTIADIFDALTSVRPYKQPMTSFEALKLMRKEMVPQHIQQDLFEKFVLMFQAPYR